MNTEDVIRLIKESKKRTLARAFVAGELSSKVIAMAILLILSVPSGLILRRRKQ